MCCDARRKWLHRALLAAVSLVLVQSTATEISTISTTPLQVPTSVVQHDSTEEDGSTTSTSTTVTTGESWLQQQFSEELSKTQDLKEQFNSNLGLAGQLFKGNPVDPGSLFGFGPQAPGHITADEKQEAMVAVLTAEIIKDLTRTGNGEVALASCGVSGQVDTSGEWSRFSGQNLSSDMCGTLLSTNCSVTYRNIKCPTECPYLAPSEAFSCLFYCVKREECATYNLNRAFPNKFNHICGECAIPGCRLCNGVGDVCEECFPDFELTADKRGCDFVLDNRMRLDIVVQVIGVVLAGLIILAFAWVWVHGAHPKADKNMVSIDRARRHRRLTKVDPNNEAEDMEILRSSATALHGSDLQKLYNSRTTNKLGVGLPLFYSGIFQLMLVGLLALVVTFAVYKVSNLSNALIGVESSLNQLLSSAISPVGAAPAVVLSTLASCRRESASDVRASLMEYAVRNFYAVGVLYVVIFITSLRHVYHKKKAAYEFDEQNSSMSDFVLRISGLPRACTDEAWLKNFLEMKFREEVTEMVDRGGQHPSGQVEVHGVSICYDYVDHRNTVDDVMWRFMELSEVPVEEMMMEARRKSQGGVQESASSAPSAATDAEARQRIDQLQKDALLVRSWFEKEKDPDTTSQGSGAGTASGSMSPLLGGGDDRHKGPLLSTGQAFVVFKYDKDREKVHKNREAIQKQLNSSEQFRDQRKQDKGPVKHKTSSLELVRMDEITEQFTGALGPILSSKTLEEAPTNGGAGICLHEVFSDPPSINWWHMGLAENEIHKRMGWAILWVIVSIVVVQAGIIYPYAKFIVWPYAATGSYAGGVKMTVAGIVLGNVNMLLSIRIYFSAFEIGYHRKDRMDSFILFANTSVVMLNTMFNILTMALMVASKDPGFGPNSMLSITTLTALHAENELAKNIFYMMFPGVFFVGYIMCILMAGVVPYIWNTILMKMIYVWRCLPECGLWILKVFLPWAPESLDEYPRRNAEKGFEPMEIGLAWEYSSFIVNPTVCFFMLIFISPYVWRIFACMLGWAVFYYVWCRYMHLRFCKACYYSTPYLDGLMSLAWGCPLAVLGAAWCLWGLRTGYVAHGEPDWIKWFYVLSSFAMSLTAWICCVLYFANPFSREDAEEKNHPDVETLEGQVVFSWYNCNPIFVLKCFYYLQDPVASWSRTNSAGWPIFNLPLEPRGKEWDHPLAWKKHETIGYFYEIGKEYLALTRIAEQLIASKGREKNSYEFETYVEKLLDTCDQISTKIAEKVRGQGPAALDPCSDGGTGPSSSNSYRPLGPCPELCA